MLKNKSTIYYFLLVILGFCVFYFSWIPSPTFDGETYLPPCIRNWSNKYYNIRTAVPFVLIGFILEIKSFISTDKISLKIKKCFKNCLFSILLVTTAEIGQSFVVHRSPDFMDVVYGLVGSILGALFFYCFNFCINKITQQ